MIVLKIDKVTGKAVKSFESVKDAAIDAQLRREQMTRHLKNRNIAPGLFYYRYGEDYDPLESFEGRQNRPVAVTDIDTGETVYFGCIKEVAEEYVIHKATVSVAIKRGSLVLSQYRMRWAR